MQDKDTPIEKVQENVTLKAEVKDVAEVHTVLNATEVKSSSQSTPIENLEENAPDNKTDKSLKLVHALPLRLVTSSHIFNVAKWQTGLSFWQKTFIFLAFMPAVIVLVYNLWFASPIFVSQTKFSIQNTQSVMPLDMASFFLSGGSSASNNSYVIIEYINSLALAKKANEELHFAQEYSSPDLDMYYRLTQNPTNKELLDYWNWTVSPTLDTDTGIINLEVKAFTPEFAEKISTFILGASEELVNNMNVRSQADSLSLAKHEVQVAEDRVKASQVAMRAFRDTHITLDPLATASSLQGLVGVLEAKYTEISTQLNEARAFMKEDAPTVINLERSLSAVKKQLEEEKKRIAGNSEQNINLNSVVGNYEDLVLENEFAHKQLVTAMASLESARVQQTAKSSYLVPIEAPSLPDEALYPKPFVFSFYTFLMTLLLLSLISLIVAAVREHTGF